KPLYNAWVAAHAYVVDDRVEENHINYRCLIAHTSSATFAPDLAANKWQKEDSAADPPAWATNKNYTINQRVKQSGTIYQCLVNHKSTTFAADLAANKWRALPRGTPTRPIHEQVTPYLEDDLR